MRACTQLTTDGNYQARGAGLQLLGDLCRGNSGKTLFKNKESLPRENKGTLRENLVYPISIFLAPVACNIMYGFSNCQRPPINCEPR